MSEQIIIDGVDVSGCEFRFCTYGCDCMSSNRETKVLTESAHCSDNHNCYYKQLKRKEQEYEELRQYHNKCCEEFEKEKQNLIDRYNQFSKDFFIGKYCKKEYCDLLKAKEKEYEELKKQRQADKGLITSTGKMNYQLIQEYDKLKNCLTEIKGIAEKSCCLQPTSTCEEYENCKECSRTSDDETVKQILQKISECEGNNEN